MAKELTEQIASVALARLERLREQKRKDANRAQSVGFVSISKPVSKRNAKSMGHKTLTLKLRNWQIRDAHFN